MIGDVASTLAGYAVIIPAFLFAVSFHEFAHALMATLLGDDTAKRLGRLTLNPLKHIDPMGLLFLLIFRIGWARPVPFNRENFIKPKLYSVLTGLAGPFSNFLLALVCMYGIAYLPFSMMYAGIARSLKQILEISVWINVMLGTFNLLPIPPLDGSHLLYALIPDKYQHVYYLIQRYAFFLILFLVFMPTTRALLFQAIMFMKSSLAQLVIT